ncbi:MAG: 4-(cytidine 5'-diphospho)-2-C-methyl-D-erythritol kinase [Rhodospirillaceae bacterium]|nr:4-(cytidine 5'-diphospho)-2-C-methyl-D-erythritol kinase [Rhodospirillaceae bacterium]
MGRQPGFAVAAPAKLNLYLQVIGRRDDGYHLLDSLVAFADLGDTVTVREAETLGLTLAGPFADALDAEPDNLVLRAARMLAEAAGIRPAASIHLEKRLPVAAGIGGGSADAAATLRGLSALWGLDVPPEDLAAIGLRLGADLPVCLGGRAAFVRGMGETLIPLTWRWPETYVVLVNPRVAVPTGSVFRGLGGVFTEPPAPFPAPDSLAAAVLGLRERTNDLEAPAIRSVPVIADVLRRLEAETSCLLARMSGSGGTCFGLFGAASTAAAAAEAIGNAHPRWWVGSGRLLTDEPAAVLPIDDIPSNRNNELCQIS